jgi:hypothetical protein
METAIVIGGIAAIGFGVMLARGAWKSAGPRVAVIAGALSALLAGGLFFAGTLHSIDCAYSAGEGPCSGP